MRVRTFTADTMAAAMSRVRETLGDDAVILSAKENGTGGAEILAALDSDLATEQADARIVASAPLDPADDDAGADLPAAARRLIRALAWHGLPTGLAERLCRAAVAYDGGDLTLALAAAIDDALAFRPLAAAPSRPTLLVGPPGAGKTVTAAKLAAGAVMAGIAVTVISADTRRSGGVDQLAGFTRLLKLDLVTAATAVELRHATSRGGSLIIDGPGTNPFDPADRELIAGLVQASGAEPVLVLPAGHDSHEAADVARVFVELGAQRLIITRLDTARRYGGVLAAAADGHLPLAAASVSPFVGDGLVALNPMGLARVLLRDPEMAMVDQDFLEDKV